MAERRMFAKSIVLSDAFLDMPAFIIKRLPIRLTFDNNYFNDRYQGIPIGGYNRLIDGLLKDVPYEVNVDFFHSKYRDWRNIANKLIYTGPFTRPII